MGRYTTQIVLAFGFAMVTVFLAYKLRDERHQTLHYMLQLFEMQNKYLDLQRDHLAQIEKNIELTNDLGASMRLNIQCLRERVVP